MGGTHGSSRWTGAICVLVVVLAFALLLPSAAAAATTRFSYLRPIANSNTSNPKPRVSVVVYDSQGVRGARGDAYTMSVDRAGVPVKMYRYRGYGYRKFKLYYDPRSPLADGSHRVHVMIRDLRGNVVRKTWYFRVDTIAPVTAASAALPDFPGVFVLGLSAADSGSGVSRTFWQFDDGPIMEGTLAWGNLGVGSHTLKYWSRDRAGNIEMVRTLSSDVISRHTTPASACSTSGCHKDGLADIHWAKGCDPCHGTGKVPSSDCVSCHGDYHAGSGGHPTIGSSGSDPVCTAAGCHGTDAVATHPTCATCHDAADPDVLAVITAPGDAVCEDCHGVDLMHPGAAVAHENTAAGSCKTVGCHNIDAVDTIHADPGCAVCHKVEAGYTLTKVCVTCHTVSPPKHTAADHVSIPNASEPSCQDALCHGTSLITTASKTTHASCATCHDGGTQWDRVVPGATQCETCHGDYTAIHGSAGATHAWTNATCAKAACHPNDIADVHTTWASPPGCFDSCHGPGKTPSANCTLAGCHPASGFEEHGYAHQNATGNFCIASGCHSGTTVLNVDPGHTPGACFCHSYATDDLNAVIEAGIGGATVKCSDCHRGAQAPHGAAHAAIDKTDSAICTSCHGTSYFTVGSRLSEEGTVAVPADLNAPVLEHQGCSCHDYGEADAPKECVDCHSPHGFSQSVAPWDPTGTWVPAGGHNTMLYGVNGGTSLFGEGGVIIKDSNEETITQEWPLPTASVFWSQSNAVRELAGETITSTVVATDYPEIALDYRGFASTEEATAAINTQVGWGSVITCYDCHTELEGLEGPQGANEANYGLDPNFPDDWTKAELTSWDPTGMRSIATTSGGSNPYYSTVGARIYTPDDSSVPMVGNLIYNNPSTVATLWAGQAYNVGEPASQGYSMGNTSPKRFLCIKCHKLVNSFQGQAIEGNGRGNRSNALNYMGFSNYPHMEHHGDMITGQGNCVSCHVAIPHGWKRPRLLVYESDPAPYKVQYVYSGYRTAGTAPGAAKDPNPDLSNGNWGYLGVGSSNTLYNDLTALNSYDATGAAQGELYASHLQRITATPNTIKALEPIPLEHFLDEMHANELEGNPAMRWDEWDEVTFGVNWHADPNNERGHYNNCSACTSAGNRHDDTVAGVDVYGEDGPASPYWK